MKKENKGITLIALIITIVVLLILAVVTVTAVNEGSIFAHANNAATKYNTAVTEENKMLSNYLTEMGKYNKTELDIWKQRGLDTTKVKVGNLYTFNTITFNGEQFDIKIELNSDGSMYWYKGEKFGDELYDSTTISEAIEANMVLCDDNLYSIYEGDLIYVTFIFEGDSAIAYQASTLGGNDGVQTNTK